jgi:hypothetical protein
MAESLESQNRVILSHLQLHKTITSKDAILSYFITRLSARIYDLRDEGHKIARHVMPNTGKGYHVKYELLDES